MLIRIEKMATKVLALICVTWLGTVNGSVLVPTYVLPPASFQRDQRSLPESSQGLRTLERLAGGHLRLPSVNYSKGLADFSKNSFVTHDKGVGVYDDKFAGVVVKTENQNVGWNQGQWDDGMLMSSAGNGKEKKKQKGSEEDEEKKTLADQVAEGKYGLIQKELFSKMPVRPGVLSYATNSETKNKDNESSLGGLKNDEIWLAEDHLLVLKGGSYSEHNAKPSENAATWPPIDAYQAPPRQVKIPKNPQVPPPFPVRLSDDSPLVFLTPNGSIPAPLFPARPPGASFGSFPSPPYPYPPAGAPPPPGAYPGNFTPGGAPFPIPPFPFFPPRNESEPSLPFPGSINSSFPGNLPPGASFLPPPGNLTDLYDEDDPSVYYPPPYSFFYQADNTSKIPAGPLVPGIVLPPPPDFFAPLEQPTSSERPAEKTHSHTPSPQTVIIKQNVGSNVYLPPRGKSGSEPLSNVKNVVSIVSTQKPKLVANNTRPSHKSPAKVVIISKPITTKVVQTTTTTLKPIKFVEKTTTGKQIKTTLKPVSGPSSNNIFYPETNYYEENAISPSPRPFLIYGPPERSQINPFTDKTYVTSTPVPLRTYYSNSEYANVIPKIQITKQNLPTVTRVRPDFIQNTGPNGKSVASFYFYEEPAAKSQPQTTTETVEYYDGRNYYQTIKNNGQILQEDLAYNHPVDNGFKHTGNVNFKPIPSREPSPFFFIPQRQGSRTLTQEYFSIQRPQQNNYHLIVPQQNRPESFYEQIANIQQTIDYYTTHRPKVNFYPHNSYRESRQKLKPTPRPVYQFSFQSNNIPQQQTGFRAPEMDSEPFRPMVTYSKPYNVENEYRSTPNSISSLEIQKGVTESPQPSKYYTTGKTNDYDYEDPKQDKTVDVNLSKPSTLRPNHLSSVRPKKNKISHPTTKNPIDHAYYTKQEEVLFDDITKNYFTIFGQKIENGNRDSVGIASTTPIRPIDSISTTTPPSENRINNQYTKKTPAHLTVDSQPIISLASDTQVNYRQPRPLINPDSEFIPIVDPEIQAKYNAEQQIKRLKEFSIHKHKHHNVEIIKSEAYEQPEKEGQEFAKDQIDIMHPIVSSQYAPLLQNNQNGRYNKGRHSVAEGQPGSLISYRLPGEGAHVYFLTPQPARNDFRLGESATLS